MHLTRKFQVRLIIEEIEESENGEVAFFDGEVYGADIKKFDAAEKKAAIKYTDEIADALTMKVFTNVKIEVDSGCVSEVTITGPLSELITHEIEDHDVEDGFDDDWDDDDDDDWDDDDEFDDAEAAEYSPTTYSNDDDDDGQ